MRRSWWAQFDFPRHSLEMCGQHGWSACPGSPPCLLWQPCAPQRSQVQDCMRRRSTLSMKVCAVFWRGYYLKELPTHYDCCGGCFSKRKKSSRSSVSAFYGVQSPGRLACSTPEPWERTETAAEPWAPMIWGVSSARSVCFGGGFINEHNKCQTNLLQNLIGEKKPFYLMPQKYTYSK